MLSAPGHPLFTFAVQAAMRIRYPTGFYCFSRSIAAWAPVLSRQGALPITSWARLSFLLRRASTSTHDSPCQVRCGLRSEFGAYILNDYVESFNLIGISAGSKGLVCTISTLFGVILKPRPRSPSGVEGTRTLGLLLDKETR